MLRLESLLDRRPRDLSGGQRQRVAIGRAIVREPDVFLFDEPLHNLDAALRVSTRVEIAKLHRLLKATMIYVTHDQIEAMTLADRIVVMNQGEIAQVGRPLDLYDAPANLFVAGFIGSPAMNLFDVAPRPGQSSAARSSSRSGSTPRPPAPRSRSACARSISAAADAAGDFRVAARWSSSSGSARSPTPTRAPRTARPSSPTARPRRARDRRRRAGAGRAICTSSTPTAFASTPRTSSRRG